MKARTDGRYQTSLKLMDGRRVYVYGKSQREVRQRLVELKVQERQGFDIGRSSQTVEAYLRSWLADERDVKPSTWKTYRESIDGLLPYIGGIKLDQLKGRHLTSAYRKLEDGLDKDGMPQRKLKAATVNKFHATVRKALREAVKQDLIPKAPTAAAKPPKASRKEQHTLSADQVQTLFESTADHPLHGLWVVLASTGVRVGEACALTWADVDFDSGRMYIRNTVTQQRDSGYTIGPAKTQSARRRITLGAIPLEALRHQRDRQKLEGSYSPQGFVFTTAEGTFLIPPSVYKTFQRCLKGLPRISVHELRHTFATLHLKAGTHPKVVQAALGHSTIAVTMNTYSHVLESMETEAAGTMDAILSRRQTSMMSE